ncbi:MAG: hypothetical protein EAX90_09300 [Candidatus Heimdallarchaeota archaeon]|nr:hypothetical protein [Candidatus Heimdallarchaeota archaeon]
MDNPRVVKIYLQARKDFEEFVGETPEKYKVLLFIDPELHNSLYQVMELGGSPHAVLSQEMIENLRKSRNRNFLPDECISVFPSSPTMIYMSLPFELEDSPERDFALRMMFVHGFAHAYFAEKSKSNDGAINADIYRMDMIIKELIMNNAYGLKEDKGITWGLPYFQDMVAVIRLLSTFGIQDFYIPPESSRKVTLFQNFLLEIISYVNKRSDSIKKKNLTGILMEGFATYITKEIGKKILDTNEYPFNDIPKLLKPIYGPPMNTFSTELIEQSYKDFINQPREIIKQVLELQSDFDLLSKYGSSSDARKLIKDIRERTQSTNVYWHSDTSGYWRKTWNIYENVWDQIDDYVKFINRFQCVNVGQWLGNSSAFTFYGYVKVDSKPIYVFEIDDESVSLEQLLILHNHSLLYRQDFKMLTPGFPDIIMFKKLDRMVVGTLLSVGGLEENPISPWDIPIYTRAIDISKELLDFVKAQKAVEEKDEEESGRVSEVLYGASKSRKQVDYSYLKKLSQSKLAAVRVLIDEIVTQKEGA